jgi:glycine betaine/proline transport system substrate-binding protein
MLENPIFYTAVAQGDVDFWSAGWFPLHDTQLPAGFHDRASIVGTIAPAGGLQGYLVTKSAAEEFGITSLDDFKRPEVKAAFDRTGDGKADLVACPPGWGCEAAIEHHLDVYDLRDHINDIKAAYNAAFADALAAYRGGQPVLYYTWTPNFTVFQMVPGEDSVWINVPEIIPSETQDGLRGRHGGPRARGRRDRPRVDGLRGRRHPDRRQRRLPGGQPGRRVDPRERADPGGGHLRDDRPDGRG